MWRHVPDHVLLIGRLFASTAIILAGMGGHPAAQASSAGQPSASLSPAPDAAFAHDTDSNSPAVWSLVDGRPTLHVLNSTAGQAALSAGRSLNRLQPLGAISWRNAAPLGGAWMESVITAADGVWYGFYHNELIGTVCPDSDKAFVQIGAARSDDRGDTWLNLGPVLELPAALVRCTTANHYFVGGVGDFSAALDRDQQFLYLFYTQYLEQDGGVGIAVARMAWSLRDNPQGAVTVWNDGAWLPSRRLDSIADEGEAVVAADRWDYPAATPVLAAPNRWDDDHDGVDVFWGPSVHWNTFLETWVMLVNRAQSNEWAQEGIYVAYAASLADPDTWSAPAKLLTGGSWYPQVIGLEPNAGTDKQAGEVARFFMGGRSDYTIRFARQ